MNIFKKLLSHATKKKIYNNEVQLDKKELDNYNIQVKKVSVKNIKIN